MTEKVLEVPAVHCDHCVSSIEGAVAQLPGVSDVRVDLEGKKVSVSYEEDAVGLDAIVAAIEDQGYDVGGPKPMQIGRPPE